MLKIKYFKKSNTYFWSFLKNISLYLNRNKPYERTLKYKNYRLHYSEGTSIVEQHGTRPVIIGGIYEPNETAVISSQLTKYDDPIFIDIGANIGLMSLNVLSKFPNSKIYAFEPGIHQFGLFNQTISSNGLEQSIFLYDVALSHKTGTETFFKHESQHVSGDGFLDTGRAGKSSSILVQTQTLDEWWNTTNCPSVHVIKIDTEGSELWVLQGAKTMINACNPDIFLEINPKNLQPYPHDASDVYFWLQEIGYSLYDLEGNLVKSSQDISSKKSSDLYLAKK